MHVFARGGFMGGFNRALQIERTDSVSTLGPSCGPTTAWTLDDTRDTEGGKAGQANGPHTAETPQELPCADSADTMAVGGQK